MLRKDIGSARACASYFRLTHFCHTDAQQAGSSGSAFREGDHRGQITRRTFNERESRRFREETWLSKELFLTFALPARMLQLVSWSLRSRLNRGECVAGYVRITGYPEVMPRNKLSTMRARSRFMGNRSGATILFHGRSNWVPSQLSMDHGVSTEVPPGQSD